MNKDDDGGFLNINTKLPENAIDQSTPQKSPPKVESPIEELSSPPDRPPKDAESSESSELYSEEEQVLIGDMLKQQLDHAFHTVDKRLRRLHKTRQNFKLKEAELGSVTFNATLHRIARQLKSKQQIQSGILASSLKSFGNLNESQTEESKKKGASTVKNVSKVNLHELSSRNSRLRSEEQGRKVASEAKNTKGHTSINHATDHEACCSKAI